MKNILSIALVFLFSTQAYTQTLTPGSPVLEDYFRRQQLLGKFNADYSFNFRPINFGAFGIPIDSTIFNSSKYSPNVVSFLNGQGVVKLLPAEVKFSYDSHHPTSRNDGAMIRARGAQTLLSAGIFTQLGPLTIQLKPEFVYAQNKSFPGFAESHFDETWARRYVRFNHIDEPERYGDSSYSKILPGQSSIRLNGWGLSLGVSTENIWWGPSMRNSIMMSNNAQGFEHITFNTSRPIKSPVGNFEWQFITGRLEASGFTPPDTSRTNQGTKLYVPKKDDWRYYQGFSLSYSPKWISGLSVGITRWVQAYSELIKETKNYLPAFSNLFRENDPDGVVENQRDQAAGLFLRWVWTDAMTEIYMEFNRNDASANFRDLILDSDHSRATTIGIHKLFNTKKKNHFLQLKWEWTQMEQTGGRLLRNAGAWYVHSRIKHGYTHNGEVIGASIGPGSNSHYLSVAWTHGMRKIGGAFERIAHDNDWFYAAFEDSLDFRRYWADFNFHVFADWDFNNLMVSTTLFYSRALNYQWELEYDPSLPYYRPGTDVGNLHFEINLTYLFN